MNPPSGGQFRVSNLAAFVWASGYAERLVRRSVGGKGFIHGWGKRLVGGGKEERKGEGN